MNKVVLLVTLVVVVFLSCHNDKKVAISDKEISTKVDTGVIAQITQKIKQTPTDAVLFKDRAVMYFTYHDIDNAIKDLETAIKLDSTNTDYLNLIADYWIIKGNSKPTKKYLDRSIAINPENTGTLIRLAKLYLYIEKHQEAFNYINEAIKINSGLAVPYFVKGLIYDDMADTLRAIKQYQTAIERNPDFYEVYILLGLKHAQLKDTLAVSYYKNAIRIKPKSVEAHYNLAMFFQENGYYDRAISEYDYILNNIDSVNYQAIYNKGYMYLEFSRNYDKALKLFTKAYQINQSSPNGIYNLGLAYEKIGNKEKAKEYYNKVLRILPSYQLAIDGLKRLN
jgi:tetratricopeptide (TPR) repeat protein